MKTFFAFLLSPIPSWLSITFGLLVLLLVGAMFLIFRKVSPKTAWWFLGGSGGWLLVLYLLAQHGFFLHFATMPPRFLVAILPPLGGLGGVFVHAAGKRWIDALPLKPLTWIHSIRIVVEWLLWELYLAHQIPQIMTFEGKNWDILAGITAPVMAWMIFEKGKWSRKVLFWWNLVSLGLLFNIIIMAILSSPLPIQQWGFEQPNVGVLKPTFIWLPGFVVPVVLFSHLVALRQLMKGYATGS
ncbi:hypothetical protein [Runella zeae]|uniref:hypothetical protein n=1 Tax=Runella zeae TaxID=94255 RepID=UPI000416240F|nr:hypothetical protein [Runella zeae]